LADNPEVALEIENKIYEKYQPGQVDAADLSDDEGDE
jgi:hypothetical protein